MHSLHLRVTGDEAGFQSIMAALEGMPHVDHVEETRGLMLGMRDDSSSSELSDDDTGNVHDIEVHAATDASADNVREAISQHAGRVGMAIEFMERF